LEKNSSLLRFILGFIVAIIGVGLLINREFFEKDFIMYGIILEFIGLSLIFTCRINFQRFKEVE
jgi:hypothetical protein